MTVPAGRAAPAGRAPPAAMAGPASSQPPGDPRGAQPDLVAAGGDAGVQLPKLVAEPPPGGRVRHHAGTYLVTDRDHLPPGVPPRVQHLLDPVRQHPRAALGVVPGT